MSASALMAGRAQTNNDTRIKPRSTGQCIGLVTALNWQKFRAMTTINYPARRAVVAALTTQSKRVDRFSVNMGRCWVLVSLACALELNAAPSVKLTGIVNVLDRPVAILDIREQGRPANQPFLKAGESDGAWEMLEVDAAAGTAAVQWNKTNRFILHLRADEIPQPNGPVTFNGTSLREVLWVYQALTGRTVIHSPTLVHSSINLETVPGQSLEECARQIEKVLSGKGTVLRTRGKEFAFAFPAKQEKAIELIPDPPPAPAPKQDDTEEIFPPGLIKFIDADAFQIVEVYSELAGGGRTALWSPVAPHCKVTVKSQAQLTRSQALWLIQAGLALGGLAIVPSGDKFAYAMPSDKAQAIPTLDLATIAAKIKKQSGAEYLKIDIGDARLLLETYSAILGREALPVPAEVPKMRFSLHTHAPLSAAERAFALEAMAALNGLGFDLVGTDQVAIRTAPAKSR